MVSALQGRVEAWGPDAVVAIARGGLVPGTMVSCGLALPMFIAGYDRKAGAVAWIGPQPEGRRVLVVDDCSATGETVAAVRQAAIEAGYDCATLTIVHDPETTQYVPDFSHPMRELFRFPWERGEATPAARSRRSGGTPAERQFEKPFFGLDLDGVFLPDIPRAHYDADLEDALRRRHLLEPFPGLPPFAADRAVVITGRPESDRAVTTAWLARHGFGGIPLACRPADVAAEIGAVSRYKAETATSWGCTHFVESEAEQAVRIAALAPHLVVSWWSAGDLRAWTIGAAAGA
jgi:adenine/guanine phosphoribosyltransferase-like PRPP-binding protein